MRYPIKEYALYLAISKDNINALKVPYLWNHRKQLFKLFADIVDPGHQYVDIITTLASVDSWNYSLFEDILPDQDTLDILQSNNGIRISAGIYYPMVPIYFKQHKVYSITLDPPTIKYIDNGVFVKQVVQWQDIFVDI